LSHKVFVPAFDFHLGSRKRGFFGNQLWVIVGIFYENNAEELNKGNAILDIFETLSGSPPVVF
jgi:hypothetical protein